VGLAEFARVTSRCKKRPISGTKKKNQVHDQMRRDPQAIQSIALLNPKSPFDLFHRHSRDFVKWAGDTAVA
jgi:hypothetical protein